MDKVTRVDTPWEEFWYWYQPTPVSSGVHSKVWTNSLVESENHGRGWKFSSLDNGGDFLAFKRSYQETCSFGDFPMHFGQSTDSTAQSGDHYHGGFYIRSDINDSNFPEVVPSSKLALRTLGTTAIARCLPTNPLGDLSVATGELLNDGLPLIPWLRAARETTSAARLAGEQYLNVDFGWKPLVRDIRKIAQSIKNRNAILDRYANNSGKRRKAQYNFPVDFDFDAERLTDVYPSPAKSHLAIWDRPYGDLDVLTTRKTTQWFKGSFTYYLPPQGAKFSRYSAEANKLLGTRLTPETLWNLAPWSWMSDWFLNYGDFLHNVVAFQNDGLVMHHGYMMEHKLHSVESTLHGLRVKSYPDRDMVLTSTLTSESKRRVRASPYGFGLTFDGFSERQKMTLIALGLAKGS